MDIRLRFPLTHPIFVEDCWPLEGYGAVLEFERCGEEVKAIVITFRDKPVSMAPRVTQIREGPVKARIDIRDGLEPSARHIIRRLSDYVNLYFFRFDIKADDVEVEYIPANDQEKAQISLPRFQSSSVLPRIRIPFYLLAQAFFAGEGRGDPSFASHLVKRAREALIAQEYIEAFRQSFLLFEALYGGGKFKTAQLVKELTCQAEFKAMVEQTIASFDSDAVHRKSKARQLVCRYASADAMIEYLVQRRGFYFHGNLARSDAWHPGAQKDAKEIAEICVELAGLVASSQATAMFEPEIGNRYLENARKQGAIMPVQVRYKFLDDRDRIREGAITINGPGTKLTNFIAVEAHKSFLGHFQNQYPDSRLLSAVAHTPQAATEVFRCEYAIGQDAQIDK